MASPAPQPRISAAKSVLFLLASGLAVYAFFELGLLDTSQVREAFSQHAGLLGLDVLCLLGVALTVTWRHYLVLSSFAPVSAGNVAAANILSLAIGQWAPGSMAVSELLRVGILLGDRNPSAAPAGLLSRLAAASFIDRAIGIGVMFCVGGMASAYVVAIGGSSSQSSIWVLGACSWGLGLTLLCLPFVDGARLSAMFGRMLEKSSSHSTKQVVRKLQPLVERLALATMRSGGRAKAVMQGALLSVLANLLTTLTYYLCTLALGTPLSPLLLAAILPLSIVATILPIGFAGFGGPQLVIAAQFALFGVPSEQILAMTLVQNALSLAVQTTLGVLLLPLYGHKLSTLLRPVKPG